MNALAVLSAIQPAPHDGETVEARYISKSGQVTRRFYPTHEALVTSAARYAPTYHCYFGVTTRVGQGGTASQTSRAGSCWSDIDAKLWASAPDPKAAALAQVEQFPLRPSVVIDSGGGFQPYWALTEPLDLQVDGARSELESMNGALARAVCGPGLIPDHVHDVARVLRIPGTINHKYAPARGVRAVWCEQDRRYQVDKLRAALAERWPWALKPTTNAEPPCQWSPLTVPAAGLWERAASGRIRRETLALLDSTGAAGYQSPSEADAAIAAGLIWAGLTEAEAFDLVIRSARGQDGFRRKGELHGDDYWRRTLSHAASYVGPVVERPGGLRVRRIPPLRRPCGVALVALGTTTDAR